MDQSANAGDKQQPDGGERIEQEADIGMNRGGRAVVLDVIQVAGVGAQPGVDNLLVWLARVVVGVSGVLPDRAAGKQKCQRHRADTHRPDRRLLQLAAKEEHDGRAEGR